MGTVIVLREQSSPTTEIQLVTRCIPAEVTAGLRIRHSQPPQLQQHQPVSDKYSSYKHFVCFELTRSTGSTTGPNGAVTNTGTSSPQTTSGSSGSGQSTTSNSGAKYSTSDKIAIGVGLGVGIPAIVVAILAWWFPCGHRPF